MLHFFLSFLIFQQALAFPRSSSPRKPTSLIGLKARNVCRQQQAAAQSEGAIPVFPSPETFRTFGELPALSADSKLDEAKDAFKNVLASREKTLGRRAFPTLDTINDLANISMNQGNYSEAFDLYERVAKAKLYKLGEADPGTLEAFNNLAVAWNLLRMLDSNAPDRIFFEKRVDYISHQSFGLVFRIKPGNYHVDEKNGWKDGIYFHFKDLYVKLYSYRETYLGKDHPDTLKTAMGYADHLNDMQELKKAKWLYKSVLKAREQVYGPSSPEALNIVDKLANLLYDQNKYDEAKELYHRVMDRREQVHGKMDIGTLSTRNNFANLLLLQGDFVVAKHMYELSLKGYEREFEQIQKHSKYAKKDKHTLWMMKEAKKGYNRAIEGFQKAFGSGHPYYLTALSNQAILLFQEVKMCDKTINEDYTGTVVPVAKVNQAKKLKHFRRRRKGQL